jgi:hypothetical protein
MAEFARSLSPWMHPRNSLRDAEIISPIRDSLLQPSQLIPTCGDSGGSVIHPCSPGPAGHTPLPPASPIDHSQNWQTKGCQACDALAIFGSSSRSTPIGSVVYILQLVAACIQTSHQLCDMIGGCPTFYCLHEYSHRGPTSTHQCAINCPKKLPKINI